MKNLLFFISFLLVISFSISEVKSISKLHVEGRYIKNETNHTVILRGVNKHGFEAYPGGVWQTPDGNYLWGVFDESVVAANLDAMKSWGINIVRSYSTAEWWVKNTSGHREIVKRYAQLLAERDMYLLYTFWHTANGTPQNSSIWPSTIFPNSTVFINMWVDIAQELKSYPNVIFSLWNEPVYSVSNVDEWFSVFQQAIDAIRSTGAENLVSVEYDGVWYNMDYPMSPTNQSTPYGATMWWVEGKPLNDPLGNLIYEFHTYRGGLHKFVNYERVNVWQYDDLLEGYRKSLVEYVVKNLSKPVIAGEIGANYWWKENDIEFQHELAYFNNSLAIFNEWEISYIGFWWWPAGAYQMLKGGANYTPNEIGQMLIDSINPSIMGRLIDKNDDPLQANITIFQEETKIFSTRTNSTGHYKVTLSPGKYDVIFDAFSIPNFFIKLISTKIFTKVKDMINNISYSLNKVSFFADIEKPQEIQVYSPKTPKRVLADGKELTKVSSYSELINNSWFFDSMENKLYISKLLLTCSDGTLYDKCSSSRPFYCDRGNLIERCDLCYCPLGLTCNVTSKKCYIEPKILFQDDFEYGNLTKWIYVGTSTGDTVTVTTNTKHRGNYSGNYTVNGDGWNEYAYTFAEIQAYPQVYVKFYVQLNKLPPVSGNTDTIAFFHRSANNLLFLSVYNNGTSHIWELRGIGFNNTYSKEVISLNTWYSIEMYLKIGENGDVGLYVNGDPSIKISNINNTGDPPHRFYMGVWTNYGPGNPHSVYFDDVVVSNVYIGP